MSHISQKKILFLITKSNMGGAQVYVRDLALAFNNNLYEPVVAVGGSGELVSTLELAGIRVIRIGTLQRDISLLKELRSFREIYRIIKMERPDILHVNSSKAGGLGAFAGRLVGVQKIVYTAHGWAYNEDRNLVSRFIVGFFHWLTILLSHKTIAVSNAVKTHMRWPFTKKKMVVLYNGVRPAAYLPRGDARIAIVKHAPELENYNNDLWTVSVGELHPIKRHDIAIRSIKKLVGKGHKVRHIIIGDGELKEKLLGLVKRLELERYVFFTGYIKDAAKYLKGFDLFVLPSRSEALCYVAIESMQAGVPVVGSNVGGIPEIVTNGKSGTLVPRENVTALTNALDALIIDPEMRKSYAEATLDDAARFSFEKMVNGAEEVYLN